ncbi:hypothetical protein [Kozakia baliensis]|uniref:Uncharacterized protein n=1 Tax=Kozakia baliensis TaxID=153496 RepID=A0A1D8UR67_9PROT|nr:hypothetical protein [Kozakia baliensis]AOX16139.1 hypothetical protein A0U89_02265 [Kozakia baliensis]GBR23376.1 phosphotransferase [Kozakia baliensis NRIC 0488]GEL65024.1 phosphotransferase [Kozakia baliensis]
MIDRAAILALIPHQGASCLLDAAHSWNAQELRASTRAHLDSANPFRRGGRLAPLIAAEMGMQAAALHGALTESEGAPGWLATLRDVEIRCERLDDPSFGVLRIDALREQGDAAGLIYGYSISTEQGDILVRGRGIVMLNKLNG